MNQDRKSSGEKHRVNHRIRCPQVKVVDETGAMLGVMPTYKAQELARDKGLDLVEVSPNAVPPVCKIMDYGKLKYDEKKAKVHHRQQKTKEIILRPGTDDHDFDFKLRHIVDFLKEGDKVHIRVKFRGRSITHPEEGQKRLLEITSHADVSSISRIEFGPRMEGRDMNLILAPASKDKRHQEDKVATVRRDTYSGVRTGRFNASSPNLSNAPRPDPTSQGVGNGQNSQGSQGNS